MRDPRSLELAPKDAKFLLAAIVESSNDAIISKNLDGLITSWNAGAERLFGYSTEEALGKHMSLLACPGRKSDMPYIMERVKRGERTEHYEAWRFTKDQREVSVSLTVSPIRNGTGQIIGASKIARDITAQKQAEEAMRQAEKLAMLGRMAATITHEIRNPLDTVTSLLFLMESCLLDQKSRDYLKTAQQELKRISRITKQTLDFSRQSTGPQTLHMEDALDSAVAFHHPTRDSTTPAPRCGCVTRCGANLRLISASLSCRTSEQHRAVAKGKVQSRINCNSSSGYAYGTKKRAPH